MASDAYDDRTNLVGDPSSSSVTYGPYGELSFKGSTVSFFNVSYEVRVSEGPCRYSSKTILHDISGIFRPGTLNAIMGPTGSGKSTLLDILAGRKHPHGLSGTVLIDGLPQPADFRLRSGYVVQDDIVMNTLTVRENLQFSADLRLPRDLSAADRRERVQAVIDQLSLNGCADTRIGDQYRRGVSGGERKRCNIGMELIPLPGILFLDEPTTGLDASTAHSVMMLLKRLVMTGSTVIFSIHQPRYSIFKLCDTVMLLGKGHTIYHGPAMEGIDFFNTCGYAIEVHDNPADFYLDVLIGDRLTSSDSMDVSPAAATGRNDDSTSISEDDDPEQVSDRRCTMLSQGFYRSQWYNRVEDDLQPYKSSISEVTTRDDITTLSYHTGFFTQFAVLCGRTIKNLIRNPMTGIMQLFITVFFGVITGGIYYQLNDQCKPGLQDRIGAFFFIVMNQIFANLSAIELFIQERIIFMHENVSGYYRVSAYFFSKLFCDLLPYRTIPTIVFGTITYWMMGLVNYWQNYLVYLVMIVMTSWSATFVAFAASASTRQQAIASLIVALVYVIQMVFSGLLINLKFIADWLKWIKYLSIFHYGMSGLMVNEFADIKANNITDPLTNSTCYQMYLEDQGIPYSTTWDLWLNVVALGAITLGFMTIAYVQLRLIKKLK